MTEEMQLLQQAGTCHHCLLSLKSHVQSGGKMTGNLLCHVPCLPKRFLPGKVGCDSCNPFLSGLLDTPQPIHLLVEFPEGFPVQETPWAALERPTTDHAGRAASHLST